MRVVLRQKTNISENCHLLDICLSDSCKSLNSCEWNTKGQEFIKDLFFIDLFFKSDSWICLNEENMHFGLYMKCLENSQIYQFQPKIIPKNMT